MAEFTLDEDQQQIQDMARKFALNELRPLAREADEAAETSPEVLAKVWELGFAASAIDEEHGGWGMGRSILNTALMAEELAYGDLSLALAALSPMMMLAPLMEAGTQEQKAEFLPLLAGESFFPATAALMEPGLSFNPYQLETTLALEDGQAVLNGAKCMVPLADSARFIVVYAAHAGRVEAVIVDRDAPGLTVGAREKNMGLNALPLYPVTLENCRVPAARVIGGGGALDYPRLVNIGRALLSAMAVGVARASYEYSLDYAKERQAFGEPIASRQAVAFMLAEMAMEVEGSRLLAWKAAWALDQGRDATRQAALAKSYTAEQTMKVVDYGVQILGGHGYIREHPVEMWFRNGRAFSFIEGLAAA